MSWLKAAFPANSPCMVVTWLTSHADMSWLKASALLKASILLNIDRMLVTRPTSHADISWLNE